MSSTAGMTDRRRWLITGVSGGLGRAIAQAVLERGDHVIGTLRRGAEDFESLAPGRAHAVEVDLARAGDIPTAIEPAVARLGGIDVLVNNAGYCLEGAVEELGAAEIEDLFAVNVFAPLATQRAVLPHMRAAGGGRIINISSMAALQSYPGMGLYCASKSALSALTDSLGLETAPFGIHATSIEAGGIRTAFAGSSLRMAQQRIDDYRALRENVEGALEKSNGNQANDPTRIAKTILALVEMADPPTRMVIGEGTLARAEATLDAKRALYRRAIPSPGLN